MAEENTGRFTPSTKVYEEKTQSFNCDECQAHYSAGYRAGVKAERKRIADTIEKETLECKHCLGLVEKLRRD